MIWSIGHSTLEIDEFISLLLENDIECLADIRSYPGSKRYPWFSQAAFKRSLKNARIDYCWIKDLGGRRGRAKDTAWEHPSFGAYAHWMETEDFERGLGSLVLISEEVKTAICCSERHHSKCHRRMVSDALIGCKLQCTHIRQDGIEPHRLTDFAVIADDGKVSYPSKQMKIL